VYSKQYAFPILSHCTLHSVTNFTVDAAMEMVSETLISFDLTRLMAEEDFIDERVLFKI
jgi:hypothetical protein